MQPIKELSSAAGQCAGRGYALVRQLANYNVLHFSIRVCLSFGKKQQQQLTVGCLSTSECVYCTGSVAIALHNRVCILIRFHKCN